MMEPLTVTLVCGGVLVGLFMLYATSLLVLPTRLEAAAHYSDEELVTTRFEAKVGFGALTLRRDSSGALELLSLGFVMWRSAAGRSLLKKVRSTLSDRERRALWLRRAERMMLIARASVPQWRFFGRLFKRFIGAVRTRVVVEGTIGFDDPADTVVFFEVLRVLTPLIPACQLALERDYFDEVLVLDVHARASLWPPRLVALGVWALTRRELWPVLSVAITGRRS